MTILFKILRQVWVKSEKNDKNISKIWVPTVYESDSSSIAMSSDLSNNSIAMRSGLIQQ